MDASKGFSFQAGARLYCIAGMECRAGISHCGYCEMHWNIVLTLDVGVRLIRLASGPH